MSADFNFSEVDRLADDFATAAVKIVADTEVKVLTPVARDVRDETARVSPRRSGELAAGWYIREGKGYRIITTDVEHAFYQEFGTSVMSPQPSLFPSSDKGGDEMAKRLEDIADPLP